MGITSVRLADLAEVFIPVGSFDTKIITAADGVAHVDVVNIGISD
jgi:hypothetical protein